jgi:hypothetical protein
VRRDLEGLSGCTRLTQGDLEGESSSSDSHPRPWHGSRSLSLSWYMGPDGAFVRPRDGDSGASVCCKGSDAQPTLWSGTEKGSRDSIAAKTGSAWLFSRSVVSPAKLLAESSPSGSSCSAVSSSFICISYRDIVSALRGRIADIRPGNRKLLNGPLKTGSWF